MIVPVVAHAQLNKLLEGLLGKVMKDEY